MIIGNREFDTENKCYVMGILNVTPDSFYDGGKWKTLDSVLSCAEDMLNQGADIIDIGGESTWPGYDSISEQEETDRVIPVVEALRCRFAAPLSIDTCKSVVAAEALRAGADMVNDIWALRRDPDMAGVVALSGAVCCLMHNRENINYSGFMQDLLMDLSESVSLAEKAGISSEKIILDPGIGFGKTYEMNLEAINGLHLIKKLGYPLLLGVSRKSVVGIALDLPVTERLEGSLAAAVIGVMRGCSFIRVHDVRETKRAVKMAEAILKSGINQE